MAYYDRYYNFRVENEVKPMTFIPIWKSNDDLYIEFDKSTMRFDSLSYKYYGDADFAWLILQANPTLGGYEYNIPNKTLIRIPYPLSSALKRFETAYNNYSNFGIT